MSAQVKMAIFYAEYILGGQIKGSFPKIMFLFKSQDGHILCRIYLELDKIQGSHKLEWLYVLFPVRIYFTSSKKVTDYL